MTLQNSLLTFDSPVSKRIACGCGGHYGCAFGANSLARPGRDAWQRHAGCGRTLERKTLKTHWAVSILGSWFRLLKSESSSGEVNESGNGAVRGTSCMLRAVVKTKRSVGRCISSLRTTLWGMTV